MCEVTVVRAAERKDVWVTPEVSDFPVEALTQGPPLGGTVDGGIYS